MNKLIAVISCVVMLVILGVWYVSVNWGMNTANTWSGYTSKTIQINTKQYVLWVADDVAKYYQGLSDLTDVSQLQGKQGMVFEFGSSSVQSFVNRRTYLNLTVLWMNEDSVVGQDHLPRLAQSDNKEVVVTSPSPVTRVVELVEN